MSSSTASGEVRRRATIGAYLAELSALIGRRVDASELGSREQAILLRTKAQERFPMSAVSFEIPFSERTTERFRQFVLNLESAKTCPVYIWTPRTIDCGTVVVPSLASLSFDFAFGLNPEGILSFVTFDLSDRILLDFGRSADGEERMTVEVQGERWASVTY